MGTLTTVVNDKYIKLLDKTIKESGMYSSRSEFLKDAVREKFAEIVEMNDRLTLVRKEAKKLAKKAKARGWNGRLPTKKEKDKWALDLMKKKGFLK